MDGFGSPVGSPAGHSPGYMNVTTPEVKLGTAGYRGLGLAVQQDSMQSPLLFKRTPGVNGTPCADSGKRFTDWVMSTSPYAGQKTPPTVSMMSVKAGDENTPPPTHDLDANAGPSGSSQHFQAWLKATSSAKWTPKRDPCAATPPPAPAPSPAGTPMSTARDLPLSAVSPAGAEPRSRPLFDLGASDSDSDDADDDGANTTVGADELAAAAARMRAALVSAGAGTGAAAVRPAGTGNKLPSTPPRAPAPTPVPSYSSAGLAEQQQLAADSLATPMSHLSMSHMPGTARWGGSAMRSRSFGQEQHQQCMSPSTAAAWSHLTPSRSQQAPASPVDKVIGLMLEPAAAVDRHHGGHHGPSRLAGGSHTHEHGSQPPPSPEQQVIQLMLQQDKAAASGGGEGHDSAAGGLSSVQQAGQGNVQHWQQQEGAAVAAEPVDGVADEQGECSSEYGSDYASSSESDDEIDVAAMRELCGAAAAPGTPISDIINMMITPELKATPSFTPGFTARGALGVEEQLGDGVGPRVLFADD